MTPATTTLPAARSRQRAVTPARRPATSELLSVLRGDVGRRPPVDPGLSGGLRAWLEDGVAPMGERVLPLRITPAALAGPWPDAATPLNDAAVLGALVGVGFRQFVTVGMLDDPYAAALGALDAAGRRDVVDVVAALDDRRRGDLRRELERQLGLMERRWPRLLPGWLPRTHERLSIPLGGGAVVLSATLDLVLGAPSAGRASVCIVSVRSGTAQPWHRPALGFLALLETLRSGAAPFRLATYYSATGDLDVEEVDDRVLAEAVERTIDALGRLATADEVQAA